MSEYSYLFAIGGRDIPIKGEFREADELYKRVDGIRAYTLGTESRESKIVVLEDCWSNDKKTLKEFLRLAVSRFRAVPSRCDTDGWHSYGTLLEKLGIERGIVHHFKEWKSVEGYFSQTSSVVGQKNAIRTLHASKSKPIMALYRSKGITMRRTWLERG